MTGAAKRTGRCGKKYGKRGQLLCRRLAGHTGHHAVRPTPAEILIIMEKRP